MDTAKLSPRQREIYSYLIGTPMQLKEIAFKMGLSDGTVKVYCADMYTKLDVSGRVDLMHAEIIRVTTLLGQKAAA